MNFNDRKWSFATVCRAFGLLSSNRGCKRTSTQKKLCSFPGKLPCKSCEAIECSLLWCLQVERNECRQESFCLLRLRPFLSVSRYSHPKWPIEFCCLKSEFWLGNRYSNIQTGAVQEKLKNGKIQFWRKTLSVYWWYICG